MAKTKAPDLRARAAAAGIQTSYVDSSGARREVRDEALQAVLERLGEGAASEDLCEPVVVCWQGRRNRAPLAAKAAAELEMEDGTRQNLSSAELDRLPALPTGYHKLHLRAGGRKQSVLLISAPVKLHSEPLREWGAFLPLYAAHSDGSWGAASFTDWKRFTRWVAHQGGGVAGTLPILSSFLDHPKVQPSPYSPASRLFWNEFFVDVTAAPEFDNSPEARRRAARLGAKLKRFRTGEFIDYASEWAARREILELLAKDLHSRSGSRRDSFEAYLRERPEAARYAEFRAAGEKYSASWWVWPKRAQKQLSRADYDEEKRHFYLYAQWLAQEQIDDTLRASREAGVKFYLDLPLGVDSDGFDVWRYPEFFARGASAGAPPDSFFTQGQDWGFAPLHPRRTRELHYRYVIDYLRFQMRHTGLLRIDHVMGLHRLWWVPHGCPASEGAYVSYPAAEMYAILSVESHRHKAILVGENLGTVPPEVNESMNRHGVRRMYVLQYEQPAHGPVRKPEPNEVASLNTHDMPAFAAYWSGEDIADRHDLGLIPKADLPRERRQRAELRKSLAAFLRKQRLLKSGRPKAREVLQAALKFLARSDAEIVLVTLEDLWLETRPQNVPGTSEERPNWKRKSALKLEQLDTDAALTKFLRDLSRLRGRAARKS
jgi:4-alpha-glucanotransferase